MSFQDIPSQDTAFAEAYRVLRPGGFFQFSITHPCFQTPKWSWVLNASGRKSALTVGDCFRKGGCRIDEWTFGAAPKELRERYGKFRIPYFEHTLSDWLNLFMASGFRIEELAEPTPTDEVLTNHPGEYDARLIAYFLIIRGRKEVA